MKLVGDMAVGYWASCVEGCGASFWLPCLSFEFRVARDLKQL
jgi:hypothetical protein